MSPEKNEKTKDVMDSILTATDDGASDQTKELDCLIYRNEDPEASTEVKKESEEPPGTSWKVSKGNVTVEIWEGKAKIKVKFGSGATTNISMKRIASIAVDAILAELEKETSQ